MVSVTLDRLSTLEKIIHTIGETNDDETLKTISIALQKLKLKQLIKDNCDTQGSNPADPEKCPSCSTLRALCRSVNRSGVTIPKYSKDLDKAAASFDDSATTWSAFAHNRAPDLLASVLSDIKGARTRVYAAPYDVSQDTRAAPMIATDHPELSSLVDRLYDAESHAEHAMSLDECDMCLQTKAAAASLTAQAYHITSYMSSSSVAWASDLLDRCIFLEKAVESRCASIHARS